jgi:hypothetical protein
MTSERLSIQAIQLPTAYAKVQAAVEWVGVEEAKAWLARNDANRPIKVISVSSMARDIEAGKFDLNGESIKISVGGRLLDGQNRLTAVVRSGSGIWTVVVRGLPEAAQETVDIGVKRTVADILSLRGESAPLSLASSLALAWKLERNHHPFSGMNIPNPSAEELLVYLGEHAGIRESVRRADQARKTSILRYPPSVAGGLHFLMSQRDAASADEFWGALESGEGLFSGDPILTLRTYLIRDLANPRRMTADHRSAITIKAWNAYRKRRTLRVIKWTRSGDKPEDFPVIG